MTIREELLALQAEHTVLQGETVIEWAQENTESALYAALEWDDKVAGHEYRLSQVRRLIAIHVVSKEGVRQLISLKIDRAVDKGGYRLIDDVLSDQNMREMMLSEALADFERLRLKYEGLREFARVWDELRAVEARARSKRRRGKGGEGRVSA